MQHHLQQLLFVTEVLILSGLAVHWYGTWHCQLETLGEGMVSRYHVTLTLNLTQNLSEMTLTSLKN